MINRFNDYEKVQAFGERRFLPKGAYVLKIMGTKMATSRNGNQYIRVSCDIADGEYMGYYTADYRSQTGDINSKKWRCYTDVYVPKNDGTEQDANTKRRFKTFVTCLEHSNDGYEFDWDEAKWKGLLIGGLFNQKQYKKADGTKSMFTQLKYTCSVDRVIAQDYRLPEDEFLEEDEEAVSQMMVELNDDSSEELPF